MLLALASGGAACAGPTRTLDSSARLPAPASSIEAALVQVTLDFEPPLRATGELHIAHESGWQHRCAAPPSGVSVRMPEGPASMRLHVAGDWFELTMHAMADGAVHVWRF